jgi:hypothetical protein
LAAAEATGALIIRARSADREDRELGANQAIENLKVKVRLKKNKR